MTSTLVDCPQCGTSGSVDFARRDAADFCRTCDYPLFWSRDRIIPPASDMEGDAGLRRLPGTVGHASLAALACPVCDEPNQPNALTCVRCGADMHPTVIEPEPEREPEPEPEPEPLPEVEPEGPSWWQRWWPIVLAGGVAVVALIVLLVVYD